MQVDNSVISMSSGMKVFFDQTQNERGRLDSTYSELAQLLKDNDIEAVPYSEYMILANRETCS